MNLSNLSSQIGIGLFITLWPTPVRLKPAVCWTVGMGPSSKSLGQMGIPWPVEEHHRNDSFPDNLPTVLKGRWPTGPYSLWIDVWRGNGSMEFLDEQPSLRSFMRTQFLQIIFGTQTSTEFDPCLASRSEPLLGLFLISWTWIRTKVLNHSRKFWDKI